MTAIAPVNNRSVLITGCSSGIGRAAAIHLSQQGFVTFATVRKEEDADRLRALGEPNLIPVCPLDMTHREHIPGVLEFVQAELSRRGIRGLYALINNAGGGGIAPVEVMDLDRFAIELQTRLVGSVALVQAFLPMIRQAHGRLVWIVTPAIFPTPYVASIHAADFAVNCLARTLQIELKPWNIPSIMIRCGGIKTRAAATSYDDLREDMQRWPADRRALYEEQLARWVESMREFDIKRAEPEAVARVIYRALVADKPKLRYSIGHMASAAALLEAMPQPVADAILSTRF